MTPTKKAPTIIGRAMLVNVCIGMWRARKHDALVTEKVNDEMAQNPKAGRYHKRLFGGENTSHSALVTALKVARRTHAAQTLPWEDSGWRLLPTANYFEYTKAIRAVQERFEAALEKFLAEYPRLIEQARERLGSMYKREDYPTVSEIRSKFHFDIQFGPLPASDDFRVTLPAEELANISSGIEDRVTNAVSDAMTDAWTRLGDVVSKLRPKLDDGKHLRSTMIDRVGEVAEILGRLNITKDAALERTRKQVLKELATLDVEILKNDDKALEKAAAKADAILKSMEGVYGG